MVDLSSIDPVVWSTIVQTVVITLTLVIFILSFRSQNQAIREQAYQKVLDEYSDSIRALSETPELHAFQMELFKMIGQRRGREPKSYTREEMIIRNYCVRMYGFFERLHFLYRRKWIDEDTWKQWAAFLELVAVHPVFREIHETSMDMWDKPFVDYVTSILNRKT
jgi:hypothetical protein